MSVITTDILLTGFRRDSVFEWLSDVANQRRVLDGAFDGFLENGPGDYDLTLNVSPKKRVVGYKFERADAEHGGRRILVNTTGKRTTGKLHFSLRTMKPSSNTLVTLHMDYEPGGPLGALLDGMGIRERLEVCFKKTLENLQREIAAN